MSRFAVVFALGLCAALAPAAPVPRAVAEKERIAERWGETAGAGEFEARGKQLTIRSAPLVPEMEPDKPSSIPHTGRKVRGDFMVTVVLLGASAPPDETGNRENSTHAGLYVSGGGCGGTFHRAVTLVRRNGELQPSFYFYRAVWSENQMSAGGAGGDEGGAIHLRVARRENVLTGSSSADGAKWSEPFTISDKLNLPDEVTVGVFAGTFAPRIVTATFTDLTIEPLKPEPKK